MAKRAKAETWEEQKARMRQERIDNPREAPPEGLKVWRQYSRAADVIRRKLRALSPEEKEGLSWELLAPEHDFWIDYYDAKIKIIDEKRGEAFFIYCNSFALSWMVVDAAGAFRWGGLYSGKIVSGAVRLAKTGSPEPSPDGTSEKKARKRG